MSQNKLYPKKLSFSKQKKCSQQKRKGKNHEIREVVWNSTKHNRNRADAENQHSQTPTHSNGSHTAHHKSPETMNFTSENNFKYPNFLNPLSRLKIPKVKVHLKLNFPEKKRGTRIKNLSTACMKKQEKKLVFMEHQKVFKVVKRVKKWRVNVTGIYETIRQPQPQSISKNANCRPWKLTT